MRPGMIVFSIKGKYLLSELKFLACRIRSQFLGNPPPMMPTNICHSGQCSGSWLRVNYGIETSKDKGPKISGFTLMVVTYSFSESLTRKHPVHMRGKVQLEPKSLALVNFKVAFSFFNPKWSK